MKNMSRSIFRPKAIRHYQQSRQIAALPKFIPLWMFVCAWVFLLLFLVVGAAVWFSEFPDYLSVPAYYLAAGSGDEMTLGLVITPQAFKQVQPGQKLLLTSLDDNTTLTLTIINTELQPLTAEQLQSQFQPALSGATLPATLNVVRARPVNPQHAPTTQGAYQAQVQIGTSRLVSFFAAPGQAREKLPR